MVARTGATVANPIEGVRLKGNWGASRSVRRAPSWRLLIRRYRGRRRCLWLGGLSPAAAEGALGARSRREASMGVALGA